jgi:hypothetical protein
MGLVTVLVTLVIGKARVCQNKSQHIDHAYQVDFPPKAGKSTWKLLYAAICQGSNFVLKASQNLTRKAKLIFKNSSLCDGICSLSEGDMSLVLAFDAISPFS